MFSVRYILMAYQAALLVGFQLPVQYRLNPNKKYRTENTENTGQRRITVDYSLTTAPCSV